MKIYISADIEGITGVTTWDETLKNHEDFKTFATQMTKEVNAACEGAFDGGATEVYVKDAHDSGRNIDISGLPENVRLQRGWMGDPLCMLSGLNETFDGVMFVGYHSGAGSATSPLAHTLNTNISHIKINGIYASEFLINAYTAALYNVPVIFVSGDKGIVDEVRHFNGNIATLAVKEGIGSGMVNMHPNKAVKGIKALTSAATSQGKYDHCRIRLPESFNVEIAYEKQEIAFKNSYYPGAQLIEPKVIFFTTNDYYEVLRFLQFVA